MSATRSSRPAAAAALPALQAASGRAQPYLGTSNGNGNGHAYANGNGHANGHVQVAKAHPANAHLAVPIAMRTMEDSQPILPPRQTGRMQASGTARPANWKSWPVVVIGIAVVAIIVAVILMVWPASTTTKADAKTLAPPPAPERMDTNPTPSTGNGPSSSVDPWKTPPGAAPDPAPTQPSNPSVPDIDQIDPPNLADPFRGGGGGGGGLSSQAALGLMSAIMKHTCDRLASCPNANDPTIKMMCDAGRLAVPNTPPPTCSAAQRCLSKIDALPCDDLDPATTLGMVQGVQDCIEAMSC